ncbi:MAG: DUF4845 domain-containing protein [Mariprofundaceae bacterium]|nr:DUF4845 domain-containing protein [Mariprofundaceae bacterium]
MKGEQGFSMIKLMLWGAIIAGCVVAAYTIFPVYNAYWKIQDTFEGVAKSMSSKTEKDIRERLPELFKIKYLNTEDIPQAFHDNLIIRASGSAVKISSSYHVTVWLMGPVKDVDPDDYEESDLKGMDKVRHKLRRDFDFEPHAETP